MAKKITIQHYYTTGSTAAPQASALALGEIAISAGKDIEGIYFKNNQNEVVNVLTSGQTNNLISTSHNFLVQQITGHTNRTDIHITANERNDWNKAKSDIDTFLTSTKVEGAIDTLKEIQDFLSGDTTGVADMLSKINQNTEDITTLKNNPFSYVQNIESGDDNINVSLKAGVANRTFVITHKAAQAESSAITATNTASELKFGSGFTILNKVAYDEKGHVVSGDTQTLTLPTLPVASQTIPGIVQLVGGNIELPSILQNTVTPGKAAASNHWHDDYVKLTDLDSGNTSGENLVISCGTY